MMTRVLIVLCLVLALPAAGAHAVEPDEVLSDSALEARARALSSELRCLVCQNQSIDDSDADLAKDLRLLVRERLVAGDTDEEVLDFVVERYGAFVLLRPPFEFSTLILWLTPFVLAVFGLAFVAFRLLRAGPQSAKDRSTRLSDDEEARIERLLEDHEQPVLPSPADRAGKGDLNADAG